MIKIKKILYLINDATNLFLKKDRDQRDLIISRLSIAASIIIVLLIVSVVANIYMYINNY